MMIPFANIEKGSVVPVIAMINRWDGRIGFLGGKVEAGETLAEAAAREAHEAHEEAGIDFDVHILEEETYVDLYIADLQPIVSHEFQAGKEPLKTHLFAIEVPKVENLIELMDLAFFDLGETVGVTLVYVGDFGKGKGFPKFLKNQMASSVREELCELILKLNLVPEKELYDMIETAGFEVDKIFCKN